MNKAKYLLGTMRLPFLALTPACVSVGVGTAYWQTGSLNGLHVLLVLIGAVAAHLTVNIFNEYFDFTTGLDARTERTPFSGGSGTLQARPELGKATLALGLPEFLDRCCRGDIFYLAARLATAAPGHTRVVPAGRLYPLADPQPDHLPDRSRIGLRRFDGDEHPFHLDRHVHLDRFHRLFGAHLAW